MTPEIIFFLLAYGGYLFVLFIACIVAQQVPARGTGANMLWIPVAIFGPFAACSSGALLDNTQYIGDCFRLTEDSEYAYCRVHSHDDKHTRQVEAARERAEAMRLLLQNRYVKDENVDTLVRIYADRAQAIWPKELDELPYKGNIIYWSELKLTLPVCGQARVDRYYLRQHE